MEVSLFYPSLALFCIILALKLFPRRKTHRRLPPSPWPALPFLGHLHLLTPPLHRTFHRLSLTHGPIFSLKLGARRVVVVSSPRLVAECFTANDVIFSNRPRVLADKYIGYNHTTMAGGPYGPHWRSLRRLAATEALAPARLNALGGAREEEMRLALQKLATTGDDFSAVELRPRIFDLIFNVIMRMLAGQGNFSGGGEEFGGRIHEMVSEVFEAAQSSNPEDFLPFLEWMDYRGLKRKLGELGKRLDDFYERLLAEHRRERRSTIIGHLLALQESDPLFYTDQTIKGFITNMIIAGTDTSVVTIEWAMSLLLNHPHILKSARLELDSVVGSHRLVEEQDLLNLNYLQNIISETFRMFPAGPLMLPRESSADCKVGGYDIQRGTILLVNAWAIHRDSDVWDEPMSFKPERFEEREVEIEKLMPFGMGRRACPGAGLGRRMVGLTLASLVHCFDWERMGPNEVDLAEGVGLTMPKLKPLEAMCRPRQIMLHALL
ncbi:cytochrome P450 81Q32-like [Salvia miltiorrhiza]|uniref:cytochrome P450 81Q32-like n=1 Tax=Salvia miltiorrhiza TaxID=226208 RepID=UPI0025AC6DCA|nr:cytochrome P450 81Q32-like [Salvia miltiorrhiza]